MSKNLISKARKPHNNSEHRVSENFLNKTRKPQTDSKCGLHATAHVAEEHVCGTAVWPAMKIQQDKLRRRRERDRSRKQRETSEERDVRLKLTAQL